MTPRTCQLCGKPLGRIRVGSGGDFCSREHRNEYRLRRSMDCLTEASKVSAVARRRENPKPLFALAALGGVSEPRGFLDAAALEPVRKGEPGYLRSALSQVEGRAGLKSEFRRPGAVACAAPDAEQPATATRREFGMSLIEAGRPHIPTPRPPVWKLSAIGGSEAPRFRPGRPTAAQGNAVRVPASVAFRSHGALAVVRAAGAKRPAKAGWAEARELPKATARVLIPAPAERREATVDPRRDAVLPPVPVVHFSPSLPSSSEWRPVRRPATSSVARGAVRLGFTDMSFVTAPDDAPPFDWMPAGPDSVSGQERRKK